MYTNLNALLATADSSLATSASNAASAASLVSYNTERLLVTIYFFIVIYLKIVDLGGVEPPSKQSPIIEFYVCLYFITSAVEFSM